MRPQMKKILLAAAFIFLAQLLFVQQVRASDTANVDCAPAYTEAEKEWIRTAPELRVTLAMGVAPLQFFDDDGKPSGVGVGWLERISAISGLKFVYNRGGSIRILKDKARLGETDIICSLPEQHLRQFEQYPVSNVYLRARTALVVNSRVNADDLSERTYAAISDSLLPDGVDPEHAVYYPSRLNCIEAVEDGDADYCYSNECIFRIGGASKPNPVVHILR